MCIGLGICVLARSRPAASAYGRAARKWEAAIKPTHRREQLKDGAWRFWAVAVGADVALFAQGEPACQGILDPIGWSTPVPRMAAMARLPVAVVDACCSRLQVLCRWLGIPVAHGPRYGAAHAVDTARGLAGLRAFLCGFPGMTGCTKRHTFSSGRARRGLLPGPGRAGRAVGAAPWARCNAMVRNARYELSLRAEMSSVAALEGKRFSGCLFFVDAHLDRWPGCVLA